jgi:hypothetical protein
VEQRAEDTRYGKGRKLKGGAKERIVKNIRQSDEVNKSLRERGAPSTWQMARDLRIQQVCGCTYSIYHAF